MSHVPVFVAEIGAYDVVGGTATTLYYSNHAFATEPTDTPADTFIDARLKQPFVMDRTLFRPGATSGKGSTGRGSITLNNADGELDFLASYAFDGREILVYQGEEGDAYPDGYTRIWKGTAVDANLDLGEVTIELRDAQEDLDVPLQTNTYAGSNVLPAGVEGVTDLKDKPKPLVFGTVRNISPPLVNTSRLIYEVSDRAVDAVDQVYDAGIPIGFSPWSWTSETTPGSTTMLQLAFSPTLGTSGRWVAVGSSGTLWTSDNDGASWTSRTSTFGTDQINDVVWDPVSSLFVAVGGQSGGSVDGIATSSDGITWTQRTNPFTQTINTIAVDDAGLFVAGANAAELCTSTNGTSWTSRTAGGAQGIYGVAWSRVRDRWVTVRASGEIWYSANGTTWTEATETPTTIQLNEVAWGNGKFVATGGNAQQVVYSEDGTHWTLAENFADTASSNMFGIAWSELLGRWVLCGADANYTRLIAVSYDAALWTVVNAAGGPTTAYAVVEGDTQLLLIGSAGTLLTLTEPTTYASEADLLDDSLAPAPGTFKYYPAGGQIRLGSPPQGVVTADVTAESAAADMTAAQLFVDVLEKAGYSNMTNLVGNDDLTTWSTSGTPVVTGSIGDPYGGTDAYRVEDDDGAGTEAVFASETYTGDGVKVFEAVFRRHTDASNYQFIRLWDSVASTPRCEIQITAWAADGTPTISVATGTHVRTDYVGNGYWRVRALSTAVTAANGHELYVYPAASGTGTLDVYRIRTYDSTTFADAWDWMDVERADIDNGTVCGLFTGTRATNVSDALSQIAQSVGAWWGADAAGVYRFRVLKCPCAEGNWLPDGRTLDVAAWTKVNVTITADDAVAPDGTTTMDKVVDDSTPAVTHRVQRAVTHHVPDDTQLEASFFIQADERTQASLRLYDKAGAAYSATIDLTDGTWSGAVAGFNYESHAEGAGYWVRISAPMGTGGTTPNFRCYMMSGGSTTYNGDGTSGMHIWDLSFAVNVRYVFTEHDVFGGPKRIASALPTYKTRVDYRKNWTLQDVGGLAGGVSETRRAVVTEPWQSEESEDATVQTRHVNARESEVETLLDTSAGAATEVARLQTLRGVRRERYELTGHLDEDTRQLDIGDLVAVEHSRFGLARRKTFTIMRLRTDAARKRLEMELWG